MEGGPPTAFFFLCLCPSDPPRKITMTQALREFADPNGDTNWNVAVEVELHTAMAMARASTQALLNLSPLAHREITEALTAEVGKLERLGDPLSVAAARALRPYVSTAA